MNIHDHTFKFFSYESDQKEKLLCILKDDINVMGREEFYAVSKLLNEFYNHPDVNNHIETIEEKMGFIIDSHIGDWEMEKGQFVLPAPPIEYGPSNKVPENGGINIACNWCRQQIYATKDTQLYTINEKIRALFMHIEAQACSKECATFLWYNQLIEHIRAERLTSHFHVTHPSYYKVPEKPHKKRRPMLTPDGLK